jgi:hypothetical protein
LRLSWLNNKEPVQNNLLKNIIQNLLLINIFIPIKLKLLKEQFSLGESQLILLSSIKEDQSRASIIFFKEDQT